MKVRPAVKEDCKTVYRFICELEETQFNYILFEKYYLHNLENKDNIYLVATNDDSVVGFLSCHGQSLLHHLDKVFEIQELYVEESYRSKKAGQLLIESLEALLKEQGHKFLEVASNIKRTNAHRFYIRNGFAQTHYRFTKTLN